MSNNGQVPKLSALRSIPDLVDIGKTAQASQSSVSRWSHKEDAQNAVIGVDRDFAFHTDIEQAPWWSLAFDAPQDLQYIVLENRRTPRFRHWAEHLTVEVQTSEGTQTVYNAMQDFGIEKEDNALVIPLAEYGAVRTITITAHTGGGPLHLSRIRVFAKAGDLPADALQSTPPLIIANRADGFGERLKAVLNAMVIADKLPGKFRFGWRPMTQSIAVWHDVLPAEQTFSTAFLDRFFLSNKEIIALAPAKLTDAVTRMPTHADQSYLVTQARLETQCRGLVDDTTGAAFKDCFERIEFIPHLERARKCAHEVDLSGAAGSAALHLRAGDLIFGRYRKMGRYHRKACAFSIAEQIAADMQAKGRPLVLFGQDNDFIAYLAERYGAISATSFAQEQDFDGAQQALFDICLMARCDEIICGSSGFATLSCWIGGVKSKSPYRYYKADKTLALLESAGADGVAVDPRISDLQRSFAIWLAFIQSGRSIADTPEYSQLLDRAIALDPQNEYFKIVKACSLIHAEEPAQADEVLLSCIRPEAAHAETLGILTGVHPDGTSQIEELLPYLEHAADAGHPAAALSVAVCKKALGRPEEAAAFKAIYRARMGNITSPLEAYLDAV